MGCGCIPEPAEFDLPQPPDPSLVWDLLVDSGESLVHFQKSRLQTCAYNPLFGFLDGDDLYLPALLCVCFIVLAIGCLASACVYRRRRQERKKCLTSSVNTSKTNSGASDDTSGGATHWSPSYNAGMNLQNNLMSRLYGSSSSTNLFHAQPVLAATTNIKQGALIRTLPKRTLPNQLTPQHQHFPSQYCIHQRPIVENPLNYCTLNTQPQYEEIGSMCLPAHYAANPICCDANSQVLLHRGDSDTIFEDLSENLRLQERRPPPISRPPPPPINIPRHYQQVHQKPHHSRHSNSSSSITDELGSGSDVELEQLAQIGVPLPIEVLNTRQQSANDLRGRESGYGTGSKARMASNWHSPPEFSKVRSPLQSSSSAHNSPPSNQNILPSRSTKHTTANNNQELCQQNMTYV